MLNFSDFVNSYFREMDSYNVFDKYSERSRFSQLYFKSFSFFSADFYVLNSHINYSYKLLKYIK